MVRALRPAVALAPLLLALAVPAAAQAPVSYQLSFPERAQRIMHVSITFPDLPDGTLELRMSRSSPGRYAAHDFAKNVFDLRATDGRGRPLHPARPNPHQWDVAEHDGTVHVTYRIFGDRLDGTYLAIDSTHAHINMPAALLWARGLDLRPVEVRFERPEGTTWRVATQLYPGADPLTFTAPNLQYLMDSPAEFSDFTERTFTIDQDGTVQTIRVAMHHQGSDRDLDGFVRDLEAIVRESRHVFGEYPAFETGSYTFIANYLPSASGDGMEHRNSTVLTSPSSIRADRLGLLNTAAHEFVHVWNVERIRPRSLEPFDFEDANIASELWFAEGFTSYYAILLLQRAGLTRVADFAQEMSRLVNIVLLSPGRQIRTPEQMSRMAPFVDAAAAIDRTNFENTFLSYYTWGAVMALGLDLTLRARSDGAVTLDDYMRALWQRHGAPGGSRPGYVDRPYTTEDLRTVLADVSGDAAFAADFFVRYVQGHDVVDLGPLVERAGFSWRPPVEGRGFAGLIRMQDAPGGALVTGAVPFGTAAFEAGLARDDLIVGLAGRPVSRSADVVQTLQSSREGDVLPIVFERQDRRIESTLRMRPDPRRQLVPLEDRGASLDDSQRRFREAWLGPSAARAGLGARLEGELTRCGAAPCR